MLPGQRYLVVSLILSVVGGFADAGSYVLAHSFTGHITGNSILMAVYVAAGHWDDVITCLVAVVAFLVGTAGGTAWPHAPGRSACRRLTGPIAVEILLIASSLACLDLVPPLLGHDLFIACLCVALGLQNGALGKIGPVSFHTTFITGLSTTLVASLTAGKPDPKRQVLPPIIGSFVAGAFSGAFTVARFGTSGFAAVLVLLALGWLLALTDPSQLSQP